MIKKLHTMEYIKINNIKNTIGMYYVRKIYFVRLDLKI